MQYILTKLETVRRVEKMQYVIEIPKKIKDKERYANKRVEENNYLSSKLSNIADSELIDDEIIDLKIKNG